MTVDVALPHGLRLVVERVAHVRTASAGLWFPAGSREDPPEGAGTAHLLEHLVFKGSGAQGARALAEAMDALGGQFNAFTGREQTCFHCRTLAGRLGDGLRLLAELVVAPRLDEGDLARERGVVLDELAMIADDPAETADELLGEALWGDHPLGRPQAGTVQSVRAVRAADLAAFHGRHYVARGAVLAVAGAVDPDRVVAGAEAAFSGLRPGAAAGPRARAVPRAAVRRRHRRTAQAHLVLGAPAPSQADEDRWAAGLLASVLGGSPSSRLFQAVREERGLCYDVGASYAEWSDAGEFVAFLSSAPRSIGAAAQVTVEEIRRLAADGVPAAELERHRAQALAGLWMAQEGTEARMMRLGRQAVSGLPLLRPADMASALRGVTARDLRTSAERLGDPACWAAAFVGPAAAPGPWTWEEGA